MISGVDRVFCGGRAYTRYILAYDKHPSTDVMNKGVEYADVDCLYRASDILSLHCPLTSDTRHLINAEAVHRMKNGVMIIRDTTFDNLVEIMRTGECANALSI